MGPLSFSRSKRRRQVDVGANSHGVVGVGGDPPPDITEYGSWRSAAARHRVPGSVLFQQINAAVQNHRLN